MDSGTVGPVYPLPLMHRERSDRLIFSPKHFAAFEHKLASSQQMDGLVHWARHSNLLSLHGFVELNLIVMAAGRFHVNWLVCDLPLVYLPRNLPSNVYRFLLAKADAITTRELDGHLVCCIGCCNNTPELLQRIVSRADEGATLDDVLHLCNHFPTVFRLECDTDECKCLPHYTKPFYPNERNQRP